MLGKLLKYDIKALWKMMLPLILSALGISVVGTVALRILVEMSNSSFQYNPFSGLFLTSLGMLVFVTVMGLIAFGVISTVFILYRYYKNLFTDEGYLTFTLPVTPNEILLSKTINGILWSAVSAVVIFVCAAMMIVLGSGGGWKTVFDEIMGFLQYTLQFMGLNSLLVAVETILTMIFSLIYSILVCYLSITIGSTVARRHKVLASIGVFFGIQFGLSTVTSLIHLVPSIYISSASIEVSSSTWTVQLTTVINLVIQAAVAVGAYLICHTILKRRLNLS